MRKYFHNYAFEHNGNEIVRAISFYIFRTVGAKLKDGEMVVAFCTKCKEVRSDRLIDNRKSCPVAGREDRLMDLLA